MSIVVRARHIDADASNYTQKLAQLIAGDTLQLAAGTYTNNLKLNQLSGTSDSWICIRGVGEATKFLSQSCCNTISLTQCSYLTIEYLSVDGNDAGVDALKAEGTSGNWAHHICVQYLCIKNFASDQQVVAISTKCPAWNWIIRKNRILSAGTGMYLGNSNGDAPFVAGVIEYNFIQSTLGYNCEIKHQLQGVRDAYSGTACDAQTIIRYNVFCKDSTSSTGSSARPNLLVGGFAASGWGSKDRYEIYGNLFVDNPTEALFQGSGSIALYANIFVNRFDPSGFRTVYITSQNNIPPRDVRIFHNTMLSATSTGGIRVYNADSKFKQLCYANAVFSSSAITNIDSSFENIVDSYSQAGTYLLKTNSDLQSLQLLPQQDKLLGSALDDALVRDLHDYDLDFDAQPYDARFRGAYATCCTRKGWAFGLDTMPQHAHATQSSVRAEQVEARRLWWDAATNSIQSDVDEMQDLCVVDIIGRPIANARVSSSKPYSLPSSVQHGTFVAYIVESAKDILNHTRHSSRASLVIVR